jgi:hypothetical protein
MVRVVDRGLSADRLPGGRWANNDFGKIFCRLCNMLPTKVAKRRPCRQNFLSPPFSQYNGICENQSVKIGVRVMMELKGYRWDGSAHIFSSIVFE